MEIGSIKKNAVDTIKCSLKEYQGHEFIDLRTFYEDDNGELKPTKKGITFSPDKIKDVIDLLEQAQIKVDAEGSKAF